LASLPTIGPKIPFFNLAMSANLTDSNTEPYTYKIGKIYIKSKSNRLLFRLNSRFFTCFLWLQPKDSRRGAEAEAKKRKTENDRLICLWSKHQKSRTFAKYGYFKPLTHLR